ncbi:MAG: 30S ribosome-binding factor RbfA [Spirochaetia bacterium]|jgi:ribosome-binding factor A|nr:30S ribosome-binding factor RbfA [Spirochaetia bacterium]
MGEFRLLRAEKLIQEELGNMILQDRIKDPRVNKLIYISSVKLSADMSFARISVSGYCPEKQTLQSVEALNHGAGFIQGIIGKKLKTRLTPKLRFIYDSSLKDGFEMNRFIEDNLH